MAARPHGGVDGGRRAPLRDALSPGRRQHRTPAREPRRALSGHGARGCDGAVIKARRLGALACLGAAAVQGAGCGGDRSRSPTCGLALLAGPALIQQQLTIIPYVLTDAPRGLPTALPARVVGSPQQGEVLITYSRQRLAMTYQGPNFPAFATDT